VSLFAFITGQQKRVLEWLSGQLCVDAMLIAPRPFMVERGYDDGAPDE
jgi:hypothetical protein